MKLIVGLGNPGKQYENTRHNVGYLVMEALESKFKFKFKNIVVKKANVFMNNSGQAVKRLIINHSSLLTDLYIVHDDLDIPLGQFKIQFGKGPKDHNGVRSVEEALGTKDFWRVRIGVENRGKGQGERAKGEPVRNASSPDSATSLRAGASVAGGDYVLQDFLPEERQIIDRVIEEIISKLTELT